jgi:hypothetical protein
MKAERERHDGTEYEHHEINWTTGVGRPAGVYWIDGRCVIVAHETPGEERLLALGAVLVATLRFDADPLETVHRHGSVDRVPASALTESFCVSGVN